MQWLSISKRFARTIKSKIVQNIFRSPRMPDDEATAGDVAESSTIQGPFWRLSDFLADNANQLTAKIVEDDRRNAAQTEEEISEWLILYDQSLEFLFAAFQAAYRQKDRWVAQDHLRSAMVMLVSATNHLLLIRHAIAFGYYPETQSLLRAVHERSSLALLFISEPDWSRKFLAGDRIDQVNVDRALADSFGDDNDPDDAKAIYDSFRGKFERRSKVTHPNLQSFVGRTAEFTYEDWKNDEISALAGSVGKDIFLGGLQSGPTAQAQLADALSEMLELMAVTELVVTDDSGDLRVRYFELRGLTETALAKFNEIDPADVV